jgi:hypothetical protein
MKSATMSGTTETQRGKAATETPLPLVGAVMTARFIAAGFEAYSIRAYSCSNPKSC